MRTSFASLASLLSLGLAAPALALTIDNFEAGPFSVSAPAPPASGSQQSGLGGNAVGGVRLVRSVRTNGGTTTGTLATTAGDDAALISFSDLVAPFGSGDVTFTYDGIADNVPNASAGALNLDMTVFTTIDVFVNAPAGSGGLQVTLWDASTTQSSAIQPVVNGNNAFLLSTFGTLDLAAIKTIRVSVLGLDAGESISVYDISTDAVPIPEPGTALLLGLGLAGLALRRGRAR